MGEQLPDLQDRLPHVSEEELLRMVTIDRDQYRPEAAALVLAELKLRGVSDITQQHYESLRASRQATEDGSRTIPGRWQAFINPQIVDVASARRAARQGAVAAIVTAAVTTIFAVLALKDIQAIKTLGLDAFAFVDAGVFLALAFGIWRGSRAAAVSALTLFIIEKILMWTDAKVAPGALALFLGLAFVNGIRGTFALRKLATKTSTHEYQPVEPS